jgi:hypothetical protein
MEPDCSSGRPSRLPEVVIEFKRLRVLDMNDPGDASEAGSSFVLVLV